MNEPLLMIPGPTMLPPEVREALARPSIFHRDARFADLLAECTAGLQALFGTAEPVATLTSSGTGAMEAVIAGTVSRGDRVLAVNGGKFGQRLGQIAAEYGAEVDLLEVPPGAAAKPDEVSEALRRASYRALLFVYNETSTGVKQAPAPLARVAREGGALVIVDAVSAIAGMPLQMDDWGLDAVGAGSQKALMLPPGLAFAALSPRAQEVAAEARTPGYYFSLPKALAALAKGQTPYTPNVNMIVALQASLRLINAEGPAAFQQRHRDLARACRAAARAAGLALLAEEEAVASDVVTAIRSPEGLDSGELVRRLREQHAIIISGGQDSLKGKIFRIGHLGAIRLPDLLRTWEATAVELSALGHACEAREIIAAAEEAYRGS